MLYPYLIEHAINNVWCNGDQDNQLIFTGQRISKPSGALNSCTVMSRSINLPVTGKRFHVYQIGQLHPTLVGLLVTRPDWITETWFSFKEAINQLKLWVDLYTGKGLEIPRFQSYYMFTRDHDLIYIVQEDANLPINFDSERIFVRLYTNAYYQSLRSDQSNDFLYCTGSVVNTIEQLLALQVESETYQSRHGAVYSYCNGFKVDRINLTTVTLGDTVEFIYDSSVKRTVTFDLGDLPVFTSLIDQKFKYLLHHSYAANDNIDYQDDIDVHILSCKSDGRYEGHYYPRNVEDAHRMVTHRDYSIVVDYLNYIKTSLTDRFSVDDLAGRQIKVEVKIRNGGYYRPLIYDQNRLFELYKLSDDLVLQALTGVNSTLALWKAEQLEASAYTEIMRSRYQDLTLGMIQQAYGYNGISKIVGDTPSKTTLRSGRQSADLPYDLYTNCTVYEYDADGLLLGYYYHSEGSVYDAVNADTRLIEAISGRGTFQPSVQIGSDNLDLPVSDNYRVYMCYESATPYQPNNAWVDITGGPLYSDINHKLVWNHLENNQYLMVRDDSTFLAYDLTIPTVGGNLFFTLAELEVRDPNQGPQEYYLPLPLGELDIFLNGHSLIPDLDYIVQFPTVYIINKKWLNQPSGSSMQHLHIRFAGFCDATLQMTAIGDYGFIEHGFLSNDQHYDIRDDKVLRITVDGSVKHRSDLTFSELHSGVSILNPTNGMPYQIKDIVVPLRGLTEANTYTLRASSQVIDQAVSDYMTLKLPQPPRDAVSAIPERYVVVSPFMARVIADLWHDVIHNAEVEQITQDTEVFPLCQPYEYLLDFDPISDAHRLNSRYVIIHPHSLNNTIDISVYKYRFLQRVVRLYGNGLIDISSFVTLSV